MRRLDELSEASYALLLSLKPLEPAPKHYNERSGVVLCCFATF